MVLPPRLAMAWSRERLTARTAEDVIRAGAGIFYNRFNEGSTLAANRFNGVKEQQFHFC